MKLKKSFQLLFGVIIIFSLATGCTCRSYMAAPVPVAQPEPEAAPVPEAPIEPIPAAEPIPVMEPPSPHARTAGSPPPPLPASEESAPAAERPTTRGTARSTRKSLTPEEVSALCDRHAKELKMADYDFRYKSSMMYDKDKVAERQEPTLKISLRRLLDGNVIVTGNEGEIFGKVKVGSLVEAALEGGDFNIKLIYPKENEGRQVLSDQKDIEWKWSIYPKRKGALPLNLYIKDIVLIDGDEKIFQTITSLHKVVTVHATTGSYIDDITTFVKKLKELILSIKGLVAATIALAGVIIYRKKSKS
jgi:hypothetical protein